MSTAAHPVERLVRPLLSGLAATKPPESTKLKLHCNHSNKGYTVVVVGRKTTVSITSSFTSPLKQGEVCHDLPAQHAGHSLLPTCVGRAPPGASRTLLWCLLGPEHKGVGGQEQVIRAQGQGALLWFAPLERKHPDISRWPPPSGIPAKSALPHNCKDAVLNPKALPVAKKNNSPPHPQDFQPSRQLWRARLSSLLVEHDALSWGPEEAAGEAFPSRSSVKLSKVPTRDTVPWGWKGGMGA